jgi:pre-mRNA-splicing factor 38B
MINCRESPYIRCGGFLYIRYLSEPQELWNRLSKYILEDEKFSPSANAKYKITIGEYVENLLKEYDYYGTRLPKIPTQIEREIKAKLISIEEKRARKRKNEKKLYLFIPNSLCSAVSFQDNKWHEAIILSLINNNRQVYVKFLNGSEDLMNMLEIYKTENKRQNFEILIETYHQLLENYKVNNIKVPFFTSEEIIDLGDIELIQRERKIEERVEPMYEEKDIMHKKEKNTKRDDSVSSSHSRRNRKDKKLRRRHKSSSSSSSSSYSHNERDRYSHRHHRDKHHKRSDRHRSKRSRSRSRSQSISSRSISSEYHRTKALKITQEKPIEEDQKK